MSRDEDQRNEMEAMEAIYGQDYSVVRTESPREYHLTLTPHQDGTTNYVQSLSGLSKQQVEHITTLANCEADNSVGTECMLQISQVVRDWLVENNKPNLSMHQQMQASRGGGDGETGDGEGDDGESEGDEDEPQDKRDARREKREAERRAARGPSPLNIAPGTLVTTQSFMEWKARFDEEQRRRREEEEKQLTAKEMKMSGKQLFLANLAKELQDDEADDLEEEKVEGGGAGGKDKPFWFNAAVYADDDAELPEDEDDKDERDEEEEESEGTDADRAKQAEEQKRREEQQRQAEEAKVKEQKRQKEEADRLAQQKQKAPQQSSKQTDAGSKGKSQQPAGGGAKGKDVKPKGKK